MRPQVTPIFPRNNGSPPPPTNLPIRNMNSRERMLSSGGFGGAFNPEIAHSVHRGHLPPPRQEFNPLSLNCISIAQHIDTCPICSRLYDTDKTLYILAIMGLLILCFLMVKRIVKL
jgi:hypothetical protein